MDVTTGTSRIEGFRPVPDVVAHLGVPFGAPPFGPHRFAAPQPVTAWSGVAGSWW